MRSWSGAAPGSRLATRGLLQGKDLEAGADLAQGSLEPREREPMKAPTLLLTLALVACAAFLAMPAQASAPRLRRHLIIVI